MYGRSRLKLVNVMNYQFEASSRLPRHVVEYYQPHILHHPALRDRMCRWNILPRFFKDASRRSLDTTMLGHKVAVPFGVAPTAMQRMAHPEGELATARAAGKTGTAFTLSTIATSSIEEVAEAAPNTLRLFQISIYKDREVTASLVRRAEVAGYSALVLTVDKPYFGNRHADVENKSVLPPHLRLANFQSKEEFNRANSPGGGSSIDEYVTSLYDPALTLQDMDWLKSITQLPIVLKGILTAEDAKLGMKAGAAAIWVSNSGSPQLDSAPPTIEALPKVVKAVGDQCEVYVDGGFSQGEHIFKALALGAKMVFLGRPVVWGLACGGEEGVEGVLKTLETELDSVMALSGCATVQDITEERMVQREPNLHH